MSETVAVNILDREFLIGCTPEERPAWSPLRIISMPRCARSAARRARKVWIASPFSPR